MAVKLPLQMGDPVVPWDWVPVDVVWDGTVRSSAAAGFGLTTAASAGAVAQPVNCGETVKAAAGILVHAIGVIVIVPAAALAPAVA